MLGLVISRTLTLYTTFLYQENFQEEGRIFQKESVDLKTDN